MKRNGFTLIELLATIVILAIVMLIASFTVNNQIKKSKLNSAIESANMIKKATDLYKMTNEKEALEIDFKTDKTDYGLEGQTPSSGYYLNDSEGNVSYNLWYRENKICVSKKKNEEPLAQLDVEESECLAKTSILNE